MKFNTSSRVKPMKNVPNEYGYWLNAPDTIGFAACDMCNAGEQDHYTQTWQNGEVTLCQDHYDIIIVDRVTKVSR